jgi:transposase-like protein
MAERIALRCPQCQLVSYRPIGFVRAKSHFVCNYCREMVRIDRHQRALALARHEPAVDVEGNVLEPIANADDGTS